MRKLGIVIALITAATLGSFGFAGTASAQNEQEPLCAQIDGTGAVLDPVGLDDTSNGAAQSCRDSNFDTGIAVSPLLCGVTQDLTDLGATPLAEGVDGVHGAIDDSLDDPLPIIDANHPCTTVTTITPSGTNGPGGGGGGGDAAVQAASAGADGGLPRTGAEMFAGAGLALMSVAALVRRFRP